MYKTIILSDSHARVAALIAWLSETHACLPKALKFSSSNAVEQHRVDYLDLDTDKGTDSAHRVFGIDAETITQPLLIPIIHSATQVILLVTKPIVNAEDSLAHLLTERSTLLKNRPYVQCFLATNVGAQKKVFVNQLSSIGINAKFPVVEMSNFKRLWDCITAFDVTQPISAASLHRSGAFASTDVASEITVDVKVEKKSRQAAIASVTQPDKQPLSAPVFLHHKGDSTMANATDSLATLMNIDGAVGCLVADYTTGMVLAKAGGGVNLDVAGAGNSEVIKSKMKTMAALGIKDTIEDILITLGNHYHILRPVLGKQGIFIYIVLDKTKANLAMARFKVLDVEKDLTL